MCSINGFNFKDEKLIRAMNNITSHRGPDGTGVFSDEGISLGHNRLSIIDLSEEAGQPMELDDGEQIISFNGEIYNFKEIKKELSESYSFKTQSDTEVILAAYKKWGKDCLSKFNGIFAFAIWDKKKKELFLARDHIGVKPLYYFWDEERFIFSSEIKAILEHDIPRILNKEAFNHYLRVLYVPEPLTMFEKIYKLPPASFAFFREGQLSVEKYWDVCDVKNAKVRPSQVCQGLTLAKCAELVKGQVRKSVEKQLVSDKPLGVYLSGGIDSSIVLNEMSQIRENIDTFTIGFDLSVEEQSDKFNQDFFLAKKTAKHYGTNHHEVLVSSKDVVGLLEKAMWHMDEPISNPTVIAMMKLAEFAKGKVDVVLGGDGGDELFGGYERYRLSRIATMYQKLPLLLRKLLSFSDRTKKLNIPAGIERFVLFMFQKDNVLKKVVNENFLDSFVTKKFFKEKYFNNNTFGSFEKNFMNTDRQSWLVDDSLARTDKMSMSAGLETRVPFLDKDLVELASGIPLKYKTNFINTKIILKEAFKKEIPKFLLKQPKRGWFSPGAKWLRNPEIFLWAKEVLSENYNKEVRDVFAWSELGKILENHRTGKKYNLTIIWAILTFQIWAKRYNIKGQ